MKKKNYTDEDIIKFSAEVKTMSGLLTKLGLKPRGSNYKTIKRKLQKLNLSCEHWTGQSWKEGERLKDWSDYTRGSNLKQHLIKERGHQCERCLNFDWGNEKIPLELHHIDGNSTNNSLENLSLLCCNCHALTDNWKSRKVKEKKSISSETSKEKPIYKCSCGNIKYKDSKNCRECNHKILLGRGQKIKWPSEQEMKILIQEFTFSQLSKKLGVSDTAIRNFCKKRGII